MTDKKEEKIVYIPVPVSEVKSDNEYWKLQSELDHVIAPLNKPCKDCAITTGFYLEFAKSLSHQSEETKEKVMDRWFCHNNCQRGCAGIREYFTPPKVTK